MRFYGLALAASALVLGACAGGDTADTTDTTAVATSDTMMGAPAATPTAIDTGAGTQAVTGTTHEVQMVIDGTEYKFVPANITVKQGDAIKFVNVSGGPHNVAFKNVPADVQPILEANMPATVGAMPKMGRLAGPLLTEYTGPNSTYTISFAGVKAGTYDYTCTPHEALGMNAKVTVQ